jgi:ketosteroid isomerase-like protein
MAHNTPVAAAGRRMQKSRHTHPPRLRDTDRAMSKEWTPDPVELTRRVYASLNDRDFDSVVCMFAPASVWDVSDWGLGIHTGLPAIGRFLKDWFGSMDEYEVHVEELHDLGNGVVRVVVEQVARPAGSRGLLRVRSAPVFVWTAGRISQVTLYRDIDKARAAAQRLAEEAGAASHQSSI